MSADAAKLWAQIARALRERGPEGPRKRVLLSFALCWLPSRLLQRQLTEQPSQLVGSKIRTLPLRANRTGVGAVESGSFETMARQPEPLAHTAKGWLSPLAVDNQPKELLFSI